MNYEVLRDKLNGIGVKMNQAAKICDMTPQGLKAAIEKNTLAIKHVVPLCDMARITLEEFFELPPAGMANSMNAQGTNINQNDSRTIARLVDIIADKDKQIDRLLTIIERK